MSLLPRSGVRAAGILGLSVAALLALLVLSPVLGGGDWRETWIVEERVRIKLDRARERPATTTAPAPASAPIVLASTPGPGATAPQRRARPASGPGRPARGRRRAGRPRRPGPGNSGQQGAPVAATPPAAVVPVAPPAPPAPAEAPTPTADAAPERGDQDDVPSHRETRDGRDAEGVRVRERDRSTSDLERRVSRAARKPVQVSLEPEHSHPGRGDDPRGGPPPGRPGRDEADEAGRGKPDGRGRKR